MNNKQILIILKDYELLEEQKIRILIQLLEVEE
jgi:hypothetical protein